MHGPLSEALWSICSPGPKCLETLGVAIYGSSSSVSHFSPVQNCDSKGHTVDGECKTSGNCTDLRLRDGERLDDLLGLASPRKKSRLKILGLEKGQSECKVSKNIGKSVLLAGHATSQHKKKIKD